MTEAVTLVVAILGSGGFGGALVALLKMPSDRNRVVVDAAQGAVVVQSNVITSLREELDRQKKEYEAEIAQLRTEHQGCHERLVRLEQAFRAIDERRQLRREDDIIVREVAGEAGSLSGETKDGD